MSALAKYLETVRRDKNISLEESARRANMSADLYLRREQEPENVPLYMLKSMIEALDMSREEIVEFTALSTQHLRD